MLRSWKGRAWGFFFCVLRPWFSLCIPLTSGYLLLEASVEISA